MRSSHSTPLTENNVDSIVLNAVKNNKFSSTAFISHITRLPENAVQESFNRLLHLRRIYLSVGGVPKRFSHISEQNSYTDNDVKCVLEKEVDLPVLLEGTVIH